MAEDLSWLQAVRGRCPFFHRPYGAAACIYIPANKLELKVPQEEIDRRMANFVPKTKELSGYLKRYASMVSSGAEGAIVNK